MSAVNSAVPCGTGLILLILPRTDVLGYFHAVPSGLLSAPGEVSNLTADGPLCMLRAPSKLTAPRSQFGKVCLPIAAPLTTAGAGLFAPPVI